MALKVSVQSSVQSAIAELNHLKRALHEVGAAGKTLNEVGEKFSGPEGFAKLGKVADQYDRVRDNLYAMRGDAEMRRVADMAVRHGYRRDDPLTWLPRIPSFYANRTKGEELHAKFAVNLANGPGAAGNLFPRTLPEPPAQQGGINVGGVFGGLKWAGATMLGLAGINSVRQIMTSGMSDTDALRNSTESIFRRSGADESFGGLTDELRGLSHALQLTSMETAKLADEYVRASGSAEDFAGGLERSVTFGRGLGIDPGISSRLMGQASLLGYRDKASQREFAGLIAHTIGSSHMFARSEQVMEDLVGHMSTVATREGRTASTTEMTTFSTLLAGLYRAPAMAGGGGQSFMQGLKGLGSGGDLVKEMFAWQSLGGAAGFDFVRMEKLKDASPFATIKDVLGEGSEKTKLELMWPEVMRQAAWMPGKASLEDKAAYFLKHQTGMNMNLGASGIRLLNGKLGDFGQFKGWLEASTKQSLDAINPEAFGELARLYEDRGTASWQKIAKQYADNEKTPTIERDRLTKLLASNDEAGLRASLPEIVAKAGALMTPAEQDRKAQAELTTAMQSLTEPTKDIATALKRIVAAWLPEKSKEPATQRDNGMPHTRVFRADGSGDGIYGDLADWAWGKDKTPSEAWWEGEARKQSRVFRPGGSADGIYGDLADWVWGDKAPSEIFKNLYKSGKSHLHGGFRLFPEAHASMHPQFYPGEGLQAGSAGLGDTPFGRLIARGEGDYNSVNRGKAGGYRSGREDLESMTVAEVMRAQASRKFNAAGRYQITRATLQDAFKALKLTGDERFDRTTQDRIFSEYLAGSRRPAIRDFLSGKTDDIRGALKQAAMEWASVANPDTGRSHYHGKGNNRASITAAEMADALRRTRELLARNKDQPAPQTNALENLSKAFGPDPSKDWQVESIANRNNRPAADAILASNEAPKTPIDMDRAVREATTPNQANARVDGHHTLDIVMRNAEGKVFHTRRGLALSEPQVFGSDGTRKVWNDTATLPASN